MPAFLIPRLDLIVADDGDTTRAFKVLGMQFKIVSDKMRHAVVIFMISSSINHIYLDVIVTLLNHIAVF